MDKFTIEKFILVDDILFSEYINLDVDELICFINELSKKGIYGFNNDIILLQNEKYIVKGYKEFIKQQIRKNKINGILDEKK